MDNSDPGGVLAAFASNLTFDDLPNSTVEKIKDLFLDWLGSALTGRTGHPVRIIEGFSAHMGPASGASQLLTSRRWSSPFFAAATNAAASHFVEQDDLHNGSVLHPGTVVFPAALAVAQELRASGKDLIAAAVSGYEAGIRVGEFLGRTHYKTFHTTGTAGTLAAAAAVGNLLRLSPMEMLHCFGSAGTQAAGLWEFLHDAAHSKQLHASKAAANGLSAAYLAKAGLTGARRIFDGEQGMAAGMTEDAQPDRLTDGLGTRWATEETSFKFHASCRHTHPAADALLSLMRSHGLKADDIQAITAHVHQGAIDVLGRVDVPESIHQAKFSMGTVLGLIANYGSAGLNDFERNYLAASVADIRDRTTMVLDPEIDGAYPNRWIGRVTVRTTSGEKLEERILEPKGDPGNTLNKTELEFKFLQLAAFGDGASESECTRMLEAAWSLDEIEHMGDIFAPGFRS